MRLVPFLLVSTLAAQAPGKLPWDVALPMPWKPGDCGPLATPLPAKAAPATELLVRITPDGALRIVDARGMILLRTGLPGRPLHLWRDGGVPVEGFDGALPFSRSSLLSRGLGALPVGAKDFRPSLEGLLWILGDDEKMITLVHPATARVCYLPLPEGRDFQLLFHPDRLEVREGGEACWSVPWLALLPQLIQLGQENLANRPTGTALLPYPKS